MEFDEIPLKGSVNDAPEGIISYSNFTDINVKWCDKSNVVNPHNHIRSNTGKKDTRSSQSEHLARPPGILPSEDLLESLDRCFIKCGPDGLTGIPEALVRNLDFFQDSEHMGPECLPGAAFQQVLRRRLKRSYSSHSHFSHT